jgi:DNA-binding response OmpR family regulator
LKHTEEKYGLIVKKIKGPHFILVCRLIKDYDIFKIMNKKITKNNISILVIEDDKFIVNAYKIAFENEGFETKIAKSGKEAILILKSYSPNIIILDLLMPEEDGFSVLKKLQKNKKWANIPVLIASNLDDPQHIEKAKALGVGEYVVKSGISLVDLINRIKEIRNEIQKN